MVRFLPRYCGPVRESERIPLRNDETNRNDVLYAGRGKTTKIVGEGVTQRRLDALNALWDGRACDKDRTGLNRKSQSNDSKKGFDMKQGNESLQNGSSPDAIASMLAGNILATHFERKPAVAQSVLQGCRRNGGQGHADEDVQTDAQSLLQAEAAWRDRGQGYADENVQTHAQSLLQVRRRNGGQGHTDEDVQADAQSVLQTEATLRDGRQGHADEDLQADPQSLLQTTRLNLLLAVAPAALPA